MWLGDLLLARRDEEPWCCFELRAPAADDDRLLLLPPFMVVFCCGGGVVVQRRGFAAPTYVRGSLPLELKRPGNVLPNCMLGPWSRSSILIFFSFFFPLRGSSC
jgi:hypothetical protein